MKKTFLFLLVFLIISSLSYCQSAKAFKNYEKGSEAIELKKYQQGIKLLTLAIEEYPSSDAYFNRAVAYLSLGDTCSFCNDLKKASGLYDQEASDQYDQKCMYTTIDKNISDSLKAKHQDINHLEIIHNKCNSDSSIVYIFENKWNRLNSATSIDTNSSPVFSMVENMPGPPFL